MTRDIYSSLTVRTCGESFLKVSVVYSLYKLLSNADGLWNPISVAGIRKDRFGDTSLPLPKRFRGRKKNRKKTEILKLVNAAMSGLPAEIFLAISVVVLSVQVSILRCTFPALSGHVLH